jgi:hypothetical protein
VPEVEDVVQDRDHQVEGGDSARPSDPVAPCLRHAPLLGLIDKDVVPVHPSIVFAAHWR